MIVGRARQPTRKFEPCQVVMRVRSKVFVARRDCGRLRVSAWKRWLCSIQMSELDKPWRYLGQGVLGSENRN